MALLGVMAESLALPADALEALATGETIVIMTERHAVDLNDELELTAPGTTPQGVFALVVAVQPAASMADSTGDAVLLRVWAGGEPVLTDGEFAARRAEVEAQWR